MDLVCLDVTMRSLAVRGGDVSAQSRARFWTELDPERVEHLDRGSQFPR